MKRPLPPVPSCHLKLMKADLADLPALLTDVEVHELISYMNTLWAIANTTPATNTPTTPVTPLTPTTNTCHRTQYHDGHGYAHWCRLQRGHSGSCAK